MASARERVVIDTSPSTRTSVELNLAVKPALHSPAIHKPAVHKPDFSKRSATLAPAASVHVTSVSDTESTLVLDLPRELAIEPSALADPMRLVLDLPKLAFVPGAETTLETGPVSAYRYGLFIADRSRIVLELRKPAEVERVDSLPTEFGVRMVVTIKAVSQERFAAAIRDAVALRFTGTVKKVAKASSSGEMLQVTQPQLTEIEVNEASPPPTASAVHLAAAPEQLYSSPSQVLAPSQALPLVIIDPGHGGIDTGAVGSGGELEKALVLEIGLQLRKKLEAGGKIRVEMTRESDTFVALPERVRLARAKSAALFLSIHADILTGEPNVRGATVYTLSNKASDASAARLAEKENKADQIAGLDSTEDAEEVSDILFDLARRETRQFSLTFAKNLITRLQGPLQINKNPHRYAGFRVLKAPDVPSVLLELGYLSSAEDAKLLMSPEWQDKVTGAAADAIERFASAYAQGQAGAQ